MGMAASQARFLSLTARKTNTEYEGQQINQQRTALSNKTANYYNDLLGMSVPVPPSVDNYTKTVYSFEDGALSNSISTMIANNDGTYTISYTSSWTDDFAAISAASSIITRTGTEGNYAYSIGEKQLRPLAWSEETTYEYSGDNEDYKALTSEELGVLYKAIKKEDDGTYTYSGEDENFKNMSSDELKAFYEDITEKQLVQSSIKFKYETEDGNIVQGLNATYNKASDTWTYTNAAGETVNIPTGAKVTADSNDAYLKTLSEDQLKETILQEEAYKAVLDKQYGTPDEGWVCRYVQNTSTGTWQPYFYKKDVLDSATYDQYDNSKSNIPAYTIGSAKKTEEIKGVEAKIEQDATGRLINITLRPGAADEATYALTTNTVTDQAAYDDAMNQYEYDKAQYDNAIQEINAKIEIIQAEDKDLELRLKQLDTEQDAISNELDAVQKVIEKNVESSFKTFG